MKRKFFCRASESRWAFNLAPRVEVTRSSLLVNWLGYEFWACFYTPGD